MNVLNMIRTSTQKQQRLSAAQMAHLQATAYRGVPYAPHACEPCPHHEGLTYRGQRY